MEPSLAAYRVEPPEQEKIFISVLGPMVTELDPAKVKKFSSAYLML